MGGVDKEWISLEGREPPSFGVEKGVEPLLGIYSKIYLCVLNGVVGWMMYTMEGCGGVVEGRTWLWRVVCGGDVNGRIMCCKWRWLFKIEKMLCPKREGNPPSPPLQESHEWVLCEWVHVFGFLFYHLNYAYRLCLLLGVEFLVLWLGGEQNRAALFYVVG